MERERHVGAEGELEIWGPVEGCGGMKNGEGLMDLGARGMEG